MTKQNVDNGRVTMFPSDARVIAKVPADVSFVDGKRRGHALGTVVRAVKLRKIGDEYGPAYLVRLDDPVRASTMRLPSDVMDEVWIAASAVEPTDEPAASLEPATTPVDVDWYRDTIARLRDMTARNDHLGALVVIAADILDCPALTKRALNLVRLHEQGVGMLPRDISEPLYQDIYATCAARGGMALREAVYHAL